MAVTSAVRRLPHPSLRAGVTLVEMMVAITVSLIMIIAMVRVFEILGNEVASGRAIIELSGQLRSATSRLERDLEGLTVPTRPWHPPAAGQGYLEIGEGPGTDYSLPTGMVNVMPGTSVEVTTWGDGFDDYLAFTSLSSGEPFYGQRSNGGTLQSQVAEVVWWTRWIDVGSDDFPEPGELTCYRRHLLVRPDLGIVRQFPETDPNDQNDLQTLWGLLVAFYNQNDISVHPEIAQSNSGIVVRMVANSLADLTKRENRFCHVPILQVTDATTDPPTLAFVNTNYITTGYPFPMVRSSGLLPSLYTTVQSGAQEGQDVILNNLLAFDLRVFDPTAPIYTDGNEAYSPGDPGYRAAVSDGAALGQGAYVDLGYRHKYNFNGSDPPLNISSVFADFSNPRPGTSGVPDRPNFGLTAVYDTWSFHYEHDGIDQNGNGLTDEGTNGLDDDGQNGVDDLGERETRPPYMVPLRAMKATFRIIEDDTRQVRQQSVVSDFIPE